MSEASPAGMMTDRAVAEADFMTLVPERVALSFSLSVWIWWCRALRKTRSLPTRGPNESGMSRGAVAAEASAGRRSLSEKQEVHMNVRQNSVVLWVIETQEHNSRTYEMMFFIFNYKTKSPPGCPTDAVKLDSTSPEPMGTLAPSSDKPLVLMGVLRVRTSPSPSSGEAKRCVSISAEKRRRAPGGLESDSMKDNSEHDRRFLQRQQNKRRVLVKIMSLWQSSLKIFECSNNQN